MISAIVLAAGQSKRMGTQKMLLPWGETSVIGKVITTLLASGLSNIHVVTGGIHSELVKKLKEFNVHFVYNPQYRNGEMLTSIQVGLKDISEEDDAVLVVLGDQPQIDVHVVQLIIDCYRLTRHKIIVPSYQMRRGHPWLLGKPFWEEILELRPPHTLRDFLNTHNETIDYVLVDNPGVIQDLDDQEDYDLYKP